VPGGDRAPGCGRALPGLTVAPARTGVDAYRRAFADVLGLGVGEVLTLADLGRQGPVPVSLLAGPAAPPRPGGP
jgi:hypothetical protein